ncbi:MAG TPA: aspartate aminotransferase family protein [Gammaproteobacteria bacterium]|nr:aspartate aminotransferase family protein [Gammaproteobacteria bacterium]HRA42217.1 aspartate aminotransferase family protein [Gammaproteobacteria bacterium]
MSHLMDVYKRLPVTFERGEGVWLWDTNGNKYLDALSGIAVSALGHGNPVLVNAIQTQAAKLIHTSNLYQIANQEKLADVLCRLTGLSQAFFCNSGAEALETALKLARLFGHEKGIDFPHIVVMRGAFHGRTLATISAGDSKKAQTGFEPLLAGFIRIPYNDIPALENLVNTHDNIAAVLVEPVQGESGIQVPDENYLTEIRKICTRQNWLMILDEVQTGLGRTGTLFAYQAHHFLPDVLTLAKALGNGMPIGACLAQEQIASLFKPGSHGSTFGGNPLSTAAALATLKEIETHKLWENAKRQGQRLLEGLKEKLGKHPCVKAIRGKGLMIGIELDRPCRDILLLALKKRILFTVSNETVIRLLPPLIINDEQVDQIITLIPELIDAFTH